MDGKLCFFTSLFKQVAKQKGRLHMMESDHEERNSFEMLKTENDYIDVSQIESRVLKRCFLFLFFSSVRFCGALIHHIETFLLINSRLFLELPT